jgi:succinate dehydrogenase / fumarate reductase cytochrome b subunit
MASLALNGGLDRAAHLYHSVVGKKVIMAVTGLLLFGFIFVHMIGNLQAFSPVGPGGVHPMDAYAKLLKAKPPLIWAARLVLLSAAFLHVLMAVQLWLMQRAARPSAYVKKASVAATYASRTMYWSGPIVGFYLVYHLLHFTVGSVHPQFVDGEVQRNLVTGFQNQAVSFFYLVANVLLATHLYHGVWSLFQTLGAAHPRYTPIIKGAAKAFAFLVGAGFCSVPLGVLTGVIK